MDARVNFLSYEFHGRHFPVKTYLKVRKPAKMAKLPKNARTGGRPTNISVTVITKIRAASVDASSNSVQPTTKSLSAFSGLFSFIVDGFWAAVGWGSAFYLWG